MAAATRSADDDEPAWHGSTIAFMSNRFDPDEQSVDPNDQILVVDVNGISEPQQITTHPADDDDPAWTE